MAEIFHLHCRQCGERMLKSREPYCGPCNLALCYRAMPLLLGLLMTGELQAAIADIASQPKEPFHTYMYAHTRHILD